MRCTKAITLILYVLCLSASIGLHGQENDDVWSEKNIYPESPQAWEFRHVSMPIPSLATGAATFDVNIYNLKVRDYSLPINIYYIGGGIKVDAEFMPVGYGWSLLPALRVTRRIMGRPDECFPVPPSQISTPSDYEIKYQSITPSYATEPNHMAYNPDKDDKYRYDPEHDIFTIHLPEKTITAIWDDGAFLAPGCKEYRIEGDKDISYIKVTDPLGRIYLFDEIGIYSGTYLMRTEWLLTSITLNTGEKINIKWEKNTGKSQPKFWNSNYITFASSLEPNSGINTVLVDNLGMSAETKYFNVKKLSSIDFPGGKINLAYQYYNSEEMLSAIEVKDDSGNTVKKATFQRNSAPLESRLLSSVTITGEGTYSFEYDSHRFDHADGRDLWGFYNGKGNSYMLSPALKIRQSAAWSTPYEIELQGADRSDNYEVIRANILIKAVYPTGGICEWEYEPHRFKTKTPFDLSVMELIGDTAISQGGGLRVKKMRLYKGKSDNNPIIKEFEYGYNGNGLGNCIAAPFLSTFITIRNRAHAVWPDGRVPVTFEDQVLTVGRRSNFMDYKYSTSPIWYDSVAVKHEEGRDLHIFKEIIDKDAEMSTSFTVIPTQINRLFAQGIQEVRTETQEKSKDGYATVQVKTNAYERYYENYWCPNYLIHRNWVQFGNKEFAPDFGYRGYCFYLDENLTFDGVYLPIPARLEVGAYSDVYRVYFYEIHPCYVRLTSSTVEDYTSNGTITRMESYEYLPSTGLISKRTIGDGVNNMVYDYHYTDTQLSTVKDEMEQANVIGMVTSVRRTFGAKGTGYKMDLTKVSGSIFRPAKVWNIRGGETWSYTDYSYDNHGNPVSANGTFDGITRTWTWDALGLYPLSESVNGILTKYAEWKPLVGVSSMTDPSGISRRFGYDSEGRLSSVSLNLKIMEKYSYRIGQDGNNEVKTTSMLSNYGGVVQTRRFDGLGRLWGEFKDLPDGTVGVLSQYDNMDRLYRVWAPASVSSSDVTENALSSASSSYHGDSNSFSEYNYEQSSRNRLLSATQAGSAYGTHPAITKKLANGSSSYLCDKYSVSSNGVRYDGKYKAGELTVEVAIDENGATEETYTDFRGLVVCKKHGNDATSYVYDDYGSLRYVLPPGVSGTLLRSDSKMKKIAYWYDYDSRGNVVLKHLPGAQDCRYLYDPAGRLVAEHSINHPEGSWRLYGYDSCGRQVVAMDISSGYGTASSWASVCRTASVSAGSDAGAYSFSPSWSGECNTVWACYYDNYDFITANGLGTEFSFSGNTSIINPPERAMLVETPISSPTGLLTGTYTGIGFESYYYNAEGLMLQTYATGYNSGRHSFKYTYDGKVSSELMDYDTVDKLKNMEISYDYDGCGRLTNTEIIQFNTGITIIKPLSITPSIIPNDTATIRCSYNALGLLEKVSLGDNSSIEMGYDIHGWINTRNYKYHGGSFNERLTYADGNIPSYNGNISSKTWLNHRYDYSYDGRNRLVSAAYTSLNSGKADYSTSYTYNERSALTRISRKGVTGIIGRKAASIPIKKGELYGVLDKISAEYDGNQLIGFTNDCEGSNYTGRTGAGVLEQPAELTYDYAGRLYSDTSRDIEQIDYNNDGLPTAIYFTSGKKQELTYDGFGRHTSTTFYSPTQSVVVGGRYGQLESTYKREYYGGGQIVDDGKLVMTRFGAGYFDDNNNTYYYFTDYQGNNISLVNKSGSIVQTTDYYPYGEIYNVSSTNPGIKNNFLYGDKEYIFMDGLHEYDYGARRSIIPLNFFGSIDPHCEKYYGISPYVLCAGNPIMRIDPNGKDCYSFDEMGKLLKQEENPEKDIITVVDSNNAEKGTPIVLPAGTIRQRSTVGSNVINGFCMEITGDDNGIRTFEYLADNTLVEWTHMKTGENVNGLNFIHTTRNAGSSGVFVNILNEITTLRERIHNHPDGRAEPSGGKRTKDNDYVKGDIAVAKYIQGMECGKNTAFYIYVTHGKYIKYGTNPQGMNFKSLERENINNAKTELGL